MQDFIFQQQVRRRRALAPSPFHADSDDYIIRQIKQKPDAKRKAPVKKASRLPAGRPVFPFSIAPFFRRALASFYLRRTIRKASPEPHGQRIQRPRLTFARFVVPSLRRLPLAGLAITAGAILAFSVLSLPWGGDNFRFLSGESFITPPADSAYQIELASYAGLVPPLSNVDGLSVPRENLETFAWTDYTVQKGDSVSRIAQRFGVSMDAVIAGNGIDNARRLKAGGKLRIPNMDGIPYTVRRGDTLAKISLANEVPLTAILDANDLDDDIITAGKVLFLPGARMKKEDLRLAMGDGFAWPVRGRLSSRFGWRKDPITGVDGIHKGIDIAAPRGTTVKAAMAGRVSFAGVNALYGKHVIVSHGKGIQTLYGHLSAVSVRPGVWLEQGDKLGEVGSTGYSTGNHLHFSIFKSGRAVNPLDYL